MKKGFLKKGLSGKYTSVFTCPNGQADFPKTMYIKHISLIVNDLNTQKYAINTEKKMVFKSLNPRYTIHAFLAYVLIYFRQVKNYVGKVKIINYLPGKAS